MNFLNLYNNVRMVFPTIYTLEKLIPSYIYKSYYLIHNIKLDGSSVLVTDNEIIIKDKNTVKYKYFEAFQNGKIIKVHIIPYDINQYTFNNIERLHIVYELFKSIVEKSDADIHSNEMRVIFKHAPFALTIILLDEVEFLLNHKDLCDILNSKYNLKYTEDMCIEILDIGLENVLELGSLYNIMSSYNDIPEINLDELRGEDNITFPD